MNKIFNDYGALRHDSPPAVEADMALREFENSIRDIISRNNLDPIEIRCLAAYCSNACVFSETALIKAIAMRKAGQLVAAEKLSLTNS